MKASFRNVEFNVISHEITFGRRQTTHAVAFEDTGARSVDVGRAVRLFSFEATVVGLDYAIVRDALIDALEVKGPGVLIHPKFGRLLCYGDDRARVRENTKATNKADFTFTLTEAADQQVQRSKPAPLGQVKRHKIRGVEAATRAFERRIGYPAISDFIEAARLTALENVLNDLRGVNGAIGSVLSVPSAYAAQIDSLSSNLALLLATPRRVFQSITAVVDNIAAGLTRVMGPAGLEGNATAAADFFGYQSRTSDGIGSLAVVARASALLGSDTPEALDVDTEERDTQRDERSAILSTTRTAMMLALADAVPDMPIDSTADVRAIRETLLSAMLDVADADDTDAEMSDALRGAAAGLSQHLQEIENQYTTYTPGTPLPAEVIAHLLYGDPERADEIIRRNRPADPGACRGFVPLEVLRD